MRLGLAERRGTIPRIREAQTAALTRLTTDVMPLTRILNSARTALAAATFAETRNDAAIRAKAASVQVAEMALAQARADAFGRIQASANKLAPDQVEVFVAMGGSFAGVSFTQPEPLNFDEHEGYVSLFDGVSLKGWDGNPKFWRVEDGAIVGESTAAEPERQQLHRLPRPGGEGLHAEVRDQGRRHRRQRLPVPQQDRAAVACANIADNVTANVGPGESRTG